MTERLPKRDNHHARQLHICELFLRCDHCGADPGTRCASPNTATTWEPHHDRIKAFNVAAATTNIRTWDTATNVENAVRKEVQNEINADIVRRLDTIESLLIDDPKEFDGALTIPRGGVFCRLWASSTSDPIRVQVCVSTNNDEYTRFKVVDWAFLRDFTSTDTLSDWLHQNTARFLGMQREARFKYARAHGEPLRPGAPPTGIPHLRHMEPL